ncbi:envelope glycoprotein H [Cercopithecine alphaherpesvirus 2]|uniref:Virion glycoprotein H n=1 Tax=Cercopithecine alphaherpesvirus 2 TaxID=10317 RepID=Q5Y0T1_9ALPH|nr:envelope glycoprotein H [Cercopithecine alphaherpesvirus 2]AAU88087.1 virion glycoprotein H [Cercopithecine alphaherpesvirus 2]
MPRPRSAGGMRAERALRGAAAGGVLCLLLAGLAVLAGPAREGERDRYWAPRVDAWYRDSPRMRAYWRGAGTSRLWLPNIPNATRLPLGLLAPPAELNLTATTAPLLRWAAPRSCFLFITTAEFPRNPGQLLYVNKTALLGLPADARLPPAAPTPRAPQLVAQLRGFLGNPSAAALLRSRAWVTHAPVWNPRSLVRPPVDPSGGAAPEAAPRPPAAPPRDGAPVDRDPGAYSVRELAATHLDRASSTWLMAAGLLRTPSASVYLSPTSATWPLAVWATGELAFGCDAALVRARYGLRFMGLSLSMRDSAPAEVVVVPAAETLALVGPPEMNEPLVLPGPPPGKRYRTFVLGSVVDPRNRSAIEALRQAARYPHEDAGHEYHLSRAYAEIFGEGAPTEPGPRPPLFWRLAARIATSGLAFVETARARGMLRLSDLVGFLTHARVLAGLALRGPAGCEPGSDFVRAPLWAARARTELEARLGRLAAEAVAGDRRLSALALAYQIAFALDDPAAEAAVAPSAARTLDALYAGFLGGRGLAAPVVRRALFYATAVLRAPAERGVAPSPEQIERGRRSLLLATAMCTSDVAVATHADLRDALGRSDHRETLFYAPDHFSPCAASLRFDLAERSFVMDTLARTPRSNASAEAMVQKTMGVASALTRWAHANALLRAFVPEASRACEGPSHNAEPLVVLPVAGNASYVVTHGPLARGVGYRLVGVDVRHPLFLTYLTEACEGRTREIEPKRLTRTETRRDLGLVGAVFMRYTPAGEITSALVVDSDHTQQQLAGGPLAEGPDVFSSDVPSTALLLFPNGTVIHLLAFDTLPLATVGPGALAASALGVVLIAAALAGLARVARTGLPSLWGS